MAATLYVHTAVQHNTTQHTTQHSGRDNGLGEKRPVPPVCSPLQFPMTMKSPPGMRNDVIPTTLQLDHRVVDTKSVGEI